MCVGEEGGVCVQYIIYSILIGYTIFIVCIMDCSFESNKVFVFDIFDEICIRIILLLHLRYYN